MKITMFDTGCNEVRNKNHDEKSYKCFSDKIICIELRVNIPMAPLANGRVNGGLQSC